MAVTVTAKNYTLLNNCNAVTNWGGGNALTTETDFYKFGSACLAYTCRQAVTYDLQYTASLDFSGTGVHLRVWFQTFAQFQTYANGGLQLFIGDATNTAYWTVMGSDTYPGGWVLLSVDVSSTPDSGTLPSNRAACTKCGIRFITTGTTKNAPSTYVDHLHIADGLIAHGDDAGGYFGIQQIYDADNTTSTARGFIKKVNGVFYLNGSLTIGDGVGTGATKFQIKSQVIVFENRKVASDLYKIEVVDNGTGITEFILGSKSGSSGIEGVVIRNELVTQNAKFSIDGGTDSDVDNFKLYGSTFLGASGISFPPISSNVEAINCNFDTCGEVIASTALIEFCNFISSVSDAIHIASTSHNIANNNFINCSRGVRFSIAGVYALDGDQFSGNTYDIHFSAATGNLEVQKTGGANPSTYLNDSTGTVSITASFSHTLTGVQENSEVTYVKVSDGTVLFHVESVTATGSTSYTHSGGDEVDILIMHLNYEPFDQRVTLGNVDETLPISQRSDPNYFNPT